MTKYTVKIFDGEKTRFYVTEATSLPSAEDRVYNYHKITVGTPIIKVVAEKIN